MATTKLTEEHPTLSAVTLDMQRNFPGVTRERVAYAARRRNIEIRDGRINREGLADVYFELVALEASDEAR